VGVGVYLIVSGSGKTGATGARPSPDPYGLLVIPGLGTLGVEGRF
jgi:hypothetical protein